MKFEGFGVTRGILLLIFGILVLVGIITFVNGFVHLFLAELSAAYVPKDVFFQRMNSATGLTGTGVVVALIGAIPFYLLLKSGSSRRHRRG